MIGEKEKKPGVCYAMTDDGVELPVIDVTHPTFALAPTDEELRAAYRKYRRGLWLRAKLPAFARAILVGYLQKRSRLLQAGFSRPAEGGAGASFLSGSATYLMKLGPANLGAAYSLPLDRKLAAAFPPFSLRVRLQDVARQLADAVQRALAKRPPGAVTLLNLAGGPSMDTLNALIVTNKERPQLLQERAIRILVCDRDAAGPAFGARALAALCAADGPLHGVHALLERRAYDWGRSATLAAALEDAPPASLAVGSSEGGLFDYGSDREVVDNLAVLRAATAPDFALVGTVIRPGPDIALAQREQRLIYHARGADGLAPLAREAGWQIAHVAERATGAQVLTLTKQQ